MPGFKKHFSLILATGFGLGFLPLAPGTWGSLLMGFLGWWLLELPLGWYLAVAGAVFLIGIITVSMTEAYFQPKTNKQWDNQSIVIDEWLGMMITLLPLLYFEKSWLWLGIGFILFRIFDIAKFGLAKLADGWKNQWGVMLDDFFAGVQAAIVLIILLLVF